MSPKRKANFHRFKTNNKKPSSTHFTQQKRTTNSKIYHHQNQLSELEVGITQFISKLDGFPGVIKARFSDFQVNEIDCDRKIAKLTNTSIPKELKIDKKDCDEAIESPLQYLPQEIWTKLKTLSKSDNMTETIDFEVENLAKDERKAIHELLKTYFSNKLCANTTNIDGKKVMQFKRHDGKQTRAKAWPEHRGEFVHFLVYKENLDTLDATMKIADCLRMSASNFSYAGVKDRRAKTTQWFSIRKVEPWKLIMKTRHMRNIKIGNICFKDQQLKLGQLYGNRFRIALRNITVDNNEIEKAVDELKTNGFINYYGLQRFGNDKEVPTFAVGVQLLLGNWKEACEIILKPIECNDPDLDITKAKRVYFDTNDPQKAVDEFKENKNRCLEFMLLSGLVKNDAKDYINALENIPRNMRLLYINSFQSLVWNRVASRRFEKFGLQAVAGDLVLVDEDTAPIIGSDESIEEEENATKPTVKALSADDLSDYTIYDIVLPLPGYDIVYPDNLKDYYQEILESFGLSLEMPKQKVQTYTLSGSYRKLMEKPEDLSWKIMHYDDPNCNLIQSDLEALKKIPEPQDVENGKYKALILEFSLKSSSYATMILREILKTDTSSSSQSKLNNYHETDDNKKANIESIIVKKGDEDEGDVDQNFGLLSDKEKYEEFKNLVFNNADNSKRQLEDGEQDGVDCKKSKLD